MQTTALKSDGILLLTAIIWGFAFVAQRVGMEYVGPFAFNGVRFALGCLVLLPFLVKSGFRNDSRRINKKPINVRTAIFGGLLAGLALFIGASLQQVGLVYTTAGNAGFITGLYVVIVPVLGLFLRQRTNTGTWLGVGLATIGMYFLSVTEHFSVAYGDVLELIGAFFWAGHVLIIGWLSPRMESFKLAFLQYAACSLLSLVTSAFFEVTTLNALVLAAIPIFYGGILSVGIAYTLQVIAQKKAHPAHAAILLSLEAVFAALGGWILLKEVLLARQIAGCALMLAGMLVSQLWRFADAMAKDEM